MLLCYRGAVLACAVPWLRSLLVLHLSRIMSQESSLVSLNSLSEVRRFCRCTFSSSLLADEKVAVVWHALSCCFLPYYWQLIESRIGTLSPALQLASSLDFLCSGVSAA